MLSSVFIHNFNCFVQFEVELPSRLLLVGSNGSGKTTFWEAIAGLQDIVVRSAEVANVFPTTSLTRWSRDGDQRFAIVAQIAGETYRYEIEVVHEMVRRVPSIRREALTVEGRTLYELVDGEVLLYGNALDPTPRTRFPFGRRRSSLPELEPRHDNQRIIAFREALANAWLLAPSPRRLEPTTAREEFWLDRDGRNLASWLRGALAERSELGTKISGALSPTMPGLRSFGMVSLSPEMRELILTFRAQGTDYKISAGELSDGQRTLLMLYGFLVAAGDRATLAFIDEPETGLAPHEIQPWLSSLWSVLDERDGQAFIISHHPAVVDYVAPANVLRFSRPAGGPVRADKVTLETTGGMSVSEWLSRPWAYEDEHEEPAP